MASDSKQIKLEHTPWPTPSRAIYGFVLYVVSYVLYGAYIVWALLPDSCLAAVGITYLPARHWVITFPFLIYVFILMLLVVYGTMYLLNSSGMTFEEPDTTQRGRPSEGRSSFGCLDDLTDLDVPVEIPETNSSRTNFLIGKHSLRNRKQ